MSEYGNQDLYETFKKINDRLDGLEAQTKYPTENREKFMAACLKDKPMSECSELWDKLKEKGEQAAYGKPYGKSFIEAVLNLLEKAGIELSKEDEDKLKAMSPKTGERLFGNVLSPLPQEERTLRKLRVDLSTGELYRPATEAENEEFIREFLYGDIAHQREAALAKQRSKRRRAFATGESLEE